MSKSFKDVCIEYAEAHGCGLPLTAPEFCNALYLWVQEKDKSIADDVIADIRNEIDGIEVVAGDNITVTADDKQFTVSMTADDLTGLLQSGDKYVVVDKTEDGNGVEIHVDKALLDLISKKVDKPTTASSEVRAICAAPNGSTLYLEPEQFKGAFGIESGGGVYFGRATFGMYCPQNGQMFETNTQVNGLFAKETGREEIKLIPVKGTGTAVGLIYLTRDPSTPPFGKNVIRLWNTATIKAKNVLGDDASEGNITIDCDLTPYYIYTAGGETSWIVYNLYGARVTENQTFSMQRETSSGIPITNPFGSFQFDGEHDYYLTVTWSAI